MHYSIIIITAWMCEVFAQGQSSSSASKCLVIYETAVTCRSIGWFPVLYARRTKVDMLKHVW